MTKLKEQAQAVREAGLKALEDTKAELLKLREGKPKLQASEAPKAFNSPRLHSSMSYDEKTNSYYIDYSKL